jgi:DNA-binding transcriptional LysR family regulator
MLEVRELRLVQAIEEHGSLARAARVLATSQPALTRSLAALEARLRGKLFERGPRGAIATDLGRAVLADAAEILARLERLDRHLVEVRGGQVRDLTIVAGAYAAETVAMVAAARMLALYPRVRLRLVSTNWAEVPRAVQEREAPIGLLDLRGVQDDPGLEVERLRPQPAIFVARPGHPLTRRGSLDLADIMAFPFVFLGRVPRQVQAPIAAAREAARAAGAMHPAFPALVQESPRASLAMLRHCDAVAGVTVAVAADALRLGEVVALPWRAPWVSVHPGVVRLRGRPLGEAEQGFLDLLRGADAEAERDAIAWCAAAGLSPDCGAEAYPPPKPEAAMARSSGAASKPKSA